MMIGSLRRVRHLDRVLARRVEMDPTRTTLILDDSIPICLNPSPVLPPLVLRRRRTEMRTPPSSSLTTSRLRPPLSLVGATTLSPIQPLQPTPPHSKSVTKMVPLVARTTEEEEKRRTTDDSACVSSASPRNVPSSSGPVVVSRSAKSAGRTSRRGHLRISISAQRAGVRSRGFPGS